MRVVLDTQAGQQYFLDGVLYTSTRYLKNGVIVGKVICSSGHSGDFSHIIRMANVYLTLSTLEWIGFVTERRNGLIRVHNACLESEEETARRFDIVEDDLPSFLTEWWKAENLSD
jgi:hypothetical protein